MYSEIFLTSRYFDDDDEPATPALAYIPAPGSPTNEATCSSKVINEVTVGKPTYSIQ